MAETDNTDNTPSFEQVQALIKSQVDDYLKEQQAAPTRQQVQTEQDQARQQVADLINPFIKPDLDEARFVAADAKDYISFYSNNDDAAVYKDDVEKAFDIAKKAGRPIARADILDYVRGKEYREQPDKFKEKETDKHKRQVERAEVGVDFGSAALTRARDDVVFSADTFAKKTLEEQETALDGITF